MQSRSNRAAALAALAALAACGPETFDVTAETGSALTAQADIVGMTSALSTPAQRHIVRVQPPNRGPVYLMAVQNDGYSYQHYGLLWYRSDDGGSTWSFYRDIAAQPDPAVFSYAMSPQTLHLTADLIVVGNDIAAVYSFDGTRGSFPADAWDSRRVVYFQWWRFDGADDWNPGPRVTIASPGPGQAYHRAELARDGVGRLWVQAFLRRSGCSTVGSASCTGDLLQAWVSTDDGASFQGPQNLAALPNQIGGGRLISVGSQLLMLWGEYNLNPAQLMRRNDADPLTQWSARANAFADAASIYHGAALSAVSDDAGGLHLVHKTWVGSPDGYRLYYRHFDGSTFGAAQPFGVAADWATQPAITSTGDDVYVCVNHLIATNTNYEMRSYRLSSGFGTWEAIDTQTAGKAYPSAPDRVPATEVAIPCAFGMGNTTTWGPGHTVQIAQQPVRNTATAAATPTFSPAPGAYASAQTVTLSSATPGATIFFTTNGSTPTTASTRYAGPITVAATTTLRAIATATGFTNSAVASGTYTIQSQTAAATPTFSPAPGTYPSAQTVTLSSATPGATIYFTTNGSTPTTASTRYTGPITVAATTTIRAIATATGFTNSAVASGTYTIQSQTAAATPTFSPAPGTYPSAQTVTLSSATPGATIFFTTNGSTPTTASTRYTGPITVAVTTTLRAIATATGFTNSAVASGTFTIQSQTAAATPTFSPAPGTYPSAQTVTLSSATPGATIFFTTNGSTPTTASTRYTGPITVAVTTTLRAIATATGFTNSAVASGTFTIQSQTGVLFADEFTRTSGLGASWRTWYGGYSTDGANAVSGAPPGPGNWSSVLAPLGRNDYAVVATLSVPSGSLYSGVVARSSGSDFTANLYAAQISSTGAVNLYRRNGWTWTRLGTSAAGVQANRFYTLQLVTTGSSPVHLEVWLDGARVITYDDASAARLTSGAVGIENYDAGVRYDSFRVLSR